MIQSSSSLRNLHVEVKHPSSQLYERRGKVVKTLYIWSYEKENGMVSFPIVCLGLEEA